MPRSLPRAFFDAGFATVMTAAMHPSVAVSALGYSQVGLTTGVRVSGDTKFYEVTWSYLHTPAFSAYYCMAANELT